MKAPSSVSEQSLAQWVSQATGVDTQGVKIRFRGNDLHILCEGIEPPKRWRTVSKFIQALQTTNLDTLTGNEQPAIYQVFLYGRTEGHKLPDWCQRLYLNQLDRHLEVVHQALSEDGEQEREPGGALIVSNQSLARQGHPDAIARYLSETLSRLGVAVQVNVKKQSQKGEVNPDEGRLWIFCQSAYSPDPALIAEPVAQQLRDLKLAGFRDAAICSQVSGETGSDWILRVDLTPPEIMLKDWARWGDVQAIARLLNQALSDAKVELEANLQETTLHLICAAASDSLQTAAVPEKERCMAVITPILEALAPQGIHAATVYGQIKDKDDTPAWVNWLNLPANEHPALAASTLTLASSGDEPAITFLLSRLLNPNLDWRLRTGGIRVLLFRKADLLHVMCDAPVCPQQKPVGKKVAKFLRQLQIAGIAGVRVYGRRAGHKQPFWSYGVDFQTRKRLVPEPTPEFAATHAYVGDLFPSGASDQVLRPDLTKEQVKNVLTGVVRDWGKSARKFLLRTQLFLENDHSLGEIAGYQSAKVALVWGTLGLMLTLQADWVLGQIITRTQSNTGTVVSLKNQSPSGEKTPFLVSNSLQKSRTTPRSVFNASGFTDLEDSPESQSETFVAPASQQKATSTAILLAARSQMPTFNSRQLDEQLALYKERIAQDGKPPDVLIIGSSRALRGVDPVALSQALTTQGYTDVDVFNFGVNGATAQVVDLIMRQILEPWELPKLILWADGARAFNSGREDITFNGIRVSPGYKQLLAKRLSTESSATDTPSPAQSANEPQTPEQKPQASQTLAASYEGVNQWLNQALAGASATYSQRDQLKSWLSQNWKSLPGMSNGSETNTAQTKLSPKDLEEVSLHAVDFDGFLPLSIRYNPATYYKKHPRVSGDYDTDYKSFYLGGSQDAALQALLKFTQSRKIPVVFINTPLTQDYLDPVRSKYEQDFQQYMLRLSSRQGFIFRDLSQLWPQANDFFSDPSHLNRYGAYEVSKKLATDPMIPWPTR